ncbi:MAG: hypothetical protein IKT40_03675 [Bacilli bacterium]|nr:hypothetical protein [Bacilli bacterium]
MAQKLVDLTGATVTVPAGWSASSNYGIFNINGYIEYHDNNTIYRTYNYIQFAIGYNVGSDTPIIDTLSIVTGSGTKVFSTTNLSFMIEIYDGTDVSNQNLIQWLLDNDATIEGGVWEEERKPILIKNPIILIGSKAKKVVVDNVNMTIDVWTKEVPAGLITFTIDNVSYQAEPNMLWEDWVNSDYNTGGFNFNGAWSYFVQYGTNTSEYVINTTNEARAGKVGVENHTSNYELNVVSNGVYKIEHISNGGGSND